MKDVHCLQGLTVSESLMMMYDGMMTNLMYNEHIVLNLMAVEVYMDRLWTRDRSVFLNI